MTTVYSAWIDGKRPIYQGASELRARQWANQFAGKGPPICIYADSKLIAYLLEPDGELLQEQLEASLHPNPPVDSSLRQELGQLALSF